MPVNGSKRQVLITGGSGFVGANLAHRLLSQGESVLLLDNLSREGVERNYDWLRDTHGTNVRLEVADTRDSTAVNRAVANASAVYHFAAQVAVTTSLVEPRHDFEVNALGTLNLLEAIRSLRTPPPLIFTSTNKVYGSLPDVELREQNDRYEPADTAIRLSGINEEHRLDFYSPYGCSKGTADQYVLDYARTFGLPAVVFRMSCIYGPHQFGTEDQGWVAHFLIQALEGRPITLYGDGKQVRDILFVEDLVDAFVLAREQIAVTAGQAFNIGGGPQNTTSLRELMRCIEQLNGSAPSIEWGDWRPGDQRYYVSDFRKFQSATGWSPRVNIEEGVRRLHAWLQESHAEPAARLAAIA
ncbi:MAG: NAD-dependent epimerase/dehydratase family protein [Verrucomicrobiaceae bacterium]|nr:MAG: NAD-dependent epimerase/dehydratase family protein [Verrucomicrobiaceae bacterium]